MKRFHRATGLPLGLGLIGIMALASCGPSSPAVSQASPAATDSGGVAPAGGDIPDNQVYLTYQGSGFAIKYPEGWVQTRAANGVVFQDKDNRISVTLAAGSAPTADTVVAEIRAMSGAQMKTVPHAVTLPGGSSIAATYRVDGAADAVTGRRPHLSVDRYELGHTGQRATLDLAAPVGADNVDAYRMIAESFRWQ